MKFLIASATALLMTGFVTASTEKANAVVYCQYVSYPANCVARTWSRPASAPCRGSCRA